MADEMVTNPQWEIGAPGNGNRAVWQCPDDCARGDWSGRDTAEWHTRVVVNTENELLLRWRSPLDSPIRGAARLDAYALGDERHKDGRGGRFYWEPIGVVGRQ